MLKSFRVASNTFLREFEHSSWILSADNLCWYVIHTEPFLEIAIYPLSDLNRQQKIRTHNRPNEMTNSNELWPKFSWNW